MSQRKEDFFIGEIYHITVRGVDGREIFAAEEDHWRMVFSLFEFNTTKPVTIRRQREKRQKFKQMIRSGLASTELEGQKIDDKRDKLVEIMAFSLMPNHVHFLLRQIKPSGISIFMQKLGSGYARYFNDRYDRKGHLFQDKFTASRISGDDYLKTVIVYIHTNPVSLIEPGWKEKGIRNPQAAAKFLEEYRWSSYPDYIGRKNFPSVTERDFMLRIFAGRGNDYLKKGTEKIKLFTEAWIKSNEMRD